MNLVKRWTSSIATSFDWVISQVENHDAVVSAAIREMQNSGGRARVQLGRVRRDGERMRERLEELCELEHVWVERALRVQEQDRSKALECLSRKRQVEREIQHLQRQLKEHAVLEEQLGRDLKTIETRVEELRRKKNCLSARQYRADAVQASQPGDFGLVGEIDDIFDRWEMKISAYELGTNSTDELTRDFEREETTQSLEAELVALIAENKNQQ